MLTILRFHGHIEMGNSDNGDKMFFFELIEWLRAESEQKVRKNQRVDGVEVIEIDLTSRCDSLIQNVI